MIKKIYFLLCLFSSLCFAEEESVITDPNALLSNKLNVIVLQQTQNALPELSEKGVIIADLTVPNEKNLEAALQKFLNEPLTLSNIKSIKKTIASHYRKNGYPIVGVRSPTGQDLSQGELHLVVTVAKLGDVKVVHSKYFSKNHLKKMIRTKIGEEIRTNRMIEDLEWINDNPFRNATMIYEQGKNLSETNLLLYMQDEAPMRVFGGYENNDYQIGGHSRLFAGVNLGNLFRSSQQLNLQFVSASNIDQFWALTGNYIIPLPWRHIWRLYGSYNRTGVEIGAFGKNTGKGWYAGTRYEIVLPVYKKMSHDFIFGYDFKSTNNFAIYASNLIYNTYIDVSQFLLKYQATLTSKKSVNNLEVSLFISPGKMTPNNTDAGFAYERAGAKANYYYLQVDFERLTNIYKDFLWVLNFLGQISSTKLLPSEELNLGGSYTVRGYRENEILSDNGILLKNEIRFPSLRITRRPATNLQFLIFLDYGWANGVDPNVLTVNNANLFSAGPGMRFKLADNLTLRLDYGIEILRIRNWAAPKENIHSRFHLCVIGSF